jgi:hypothetical protein
LDKKIQYIEELVEKYYDAETTLEEEEELRDFFTNEEVPTHLLYEKAQFSYYRKEESVIKEIVFEAPKEQKIKIGRSKLFNFLNYAAAAVIMISAGWFSNDKYQDHLKEQHEIEIAYEDTQKALAFLSSNFNVGIINAQKLKEMNKSQQYIIEKKY